MHTHLVGSHSRRVPWHMQPAEGEERRVLLCLTCGQSEIVQPRGPLHAEKLDYRSQLAKLTALAAANQGRAAVARAAKVEAPSISSHS